MICGFRFRKHMAVQNRKSLRIALEWTGPLKAVDLSRGCVLYAFSDPVERHAVTYASGGASCRMRGGAVFAGSAPAVGASTSGGALAWS